MADKRISQLIERTDIANNDVLPIVASGATTTNKVTISTIQNWMQDNLDVGVTSVGITLGSSGTDVNVTGSPITTSGNITINIPTASATNRGLLSASDWSTFNGKQNSITLTTSGTSGAATLVGSTLNIPNYSTGVANAYVPYVGAIGSVTLGYNALSASQINIDGGSPTGGSYLGFKHATSVNTGTSGYTSMYTFGTNTIGFKSVSGGTNKDFSFDMSTITSNVAGGRIYSLPDASGMLALTTMLTDFVTLNTVQTITATKTFTTSGGDDTLIVDHTSGSGIAVDISKAGNGEGLRVAKTSGTGNAVTITGGLLSAEAATLTGALNGTSASFSGNVSSGGIFIGRTTNGQAFGVGNGVDTDLGIFVQTNNILFSNSGASSGYAFAVGGSTRLTISSTGAATFSSSVTAGGIVQATSTGKAFKLLSTDTTGSYIEFSPSSGGDYGYIGSAYHVLSSPNNIATNLAIRANADLSFAAGGSVERFRISSTGAATFSSNVGVGVSPSSWDAGWLGGNTNSLEVGQAGSSIAAGAGGFQMMNNAVINGGSAKYSRSFPATYYIQNTASGQHQWFTAPSGTAGNAITFTQVMTLSNTGSLGIGTASPSDTLHVAKNGTGSYSAALWTNSNSTANLYVGVGGSGVGNAALQNNAYVLNAAASALVLGTSDTERMRITAGGALQMSNNATTFSIGSISGQNRIQWDSTEFAFLNTANSYTAIGASAFNTRSDYRLKENVAPVQDALLKITSLKPCTFNFIAEPEKEVVGFIAHEVQEVFPQAISGEKDGFRIEQVEVSPAELDEEGNVITEAVIEEKEVPVYQGIDHSKLVPLLVASIQELKAEIEALKSQING